MWASILQYLNENRLLAISTPIYIVLIGAEVLASNYLHRSYYHLKDCLINLWLNLVNYSLAISTKLFTLFIFGLAYHYHLIDLKGEGPLYWTLLFLGLDFCFYWEHRCEHFSRILWAVHVTHHSSEQFNLTTGFRSSVFRPLVSLWFFLPLAWVGFKPLDILFMDAICQIYGIIVHTRFIRKMPLWFDYIFVSPSHHRVHHASNILYLDRNMGMVLIIWDRLFATFQKEEVSEVVVYGLTKNYQHPYHPIGIIFHEWCNLIHDLKQKGLTWKQRWQYLFEPPGWRHDEHSATAKELRRKEKYR